MADTNRFGRTPQFGDQIPLTGKAAEAFHCGECEAMLAAVLDGDLSRDEQERFDAHIADCAPCAAMLADAARGLAWLGRLHDGRPEPTPELFDRILAGTCGSASASQPAAASHASGSAALPQGWAGAPARAWNASRSDDRSGGILSRWRERIRAAFHGSGLVQPRLAMTTAMAFFSISLTMNLAGVRMSSLRVSELSPSSVRRGFYSAGARLVQYYEGLRVVYELESRVHDLESEPDTGSASESPAAPAPGNGVAGRANGSQPTGVAPGLKGPAPAQPLLKQPSYTEPSRREPDRNTPGAGTSRRESPFRRAHTLASARLDANAPAHATAPWGTGRKLQQGTERTVRVDSKADTSRNKATKAGSAA